MTRRLSLVSSQPAPRVAEVSCQVSPAPLPRAPRSFDMHGLRRAFPDLWAKFLRDHFAGDALRIAVFFDVTPRAAEDWLNGVSGPRGAPVAMAVMYFGPAILDDFRGAA